MTPTPQLHLVTRLRNSAAIPLLPLHAFMAWTGEKTLFFKHPINHMEGLSMTTKIFNRDEHHEKGIYTGGSGLSPVFTVARHWSQ